MKAFGTALVDPQLSPRDVGDESIQDIPGFDF